LGDTAGQTTVFASQFVTFEDSLETQVVVDFALAMRSGR
jgi:hypothetical protein